MSDAIYAGLVVVEVDGQEIEVKSISVQTETGRQGVKTMNSKGRALGYKDGIETHELTVQAPERVDDKNFDWGSVTNAKITVYPLNKADKRTSYTGCFSTSVGTSYEVESEAVVDVNLTSLEKIEE